MRLALLSPCGNGRNPTQTSELLQFPSQSCALAIRHCLVRQQTMMFQWSGFTSQIHQPDATHIVIQEFDVSYAVQRLETAVASRREATPKQQTQKGYLGALACLPQWRRGVEGQQRESSRGRH